MVREEHGQRLFVNGVLREIFGFKRHKVKGNWKTVCNGELHDLCSSPNYLGYHIKKTERSGGHVTLMEEKRKAHMVLMWKPGGNKPLG